MKEYDNIKPMHNSLNLAMSFLLSLHSLQTLFFSPSGVGYVSTEEWKQISDPSHHKYNTPARNAMHISNNSPHVKHSVIKWLLALQMEQR